MSETENPPIAKAPVELPGPSDIPHVSVAGTIKPPGRIRGALEQFLADPGPTLRSVLSRKRGEAPTDSGF
jgi:hypothetical protein